MQKTLTVSAALAALTLLGSAVTAQTPPPPPPVHHSIFGKLFHPKPKPVQPMAGSFGHPGIMNGHMMPGHSGMMGHPGMMGRPGMMGGSGMMRGGIVANRNSHVYHMPGDRGALPAAQNRIYFPTAAAAEAAGYHRAGGARATMTHHPMMQGSPMHGMPGSMSH